MAAPLAGRKGAELDYSPSLPLLRLRSRSLGTASLASLSTGPPGGFSGPTASAFSSLGSSAASRGFMARRMRSAMIIAMLLISPSTAPGPMDFAFATMAPTSTVMTSPEGPAPGSLEVSNPRSEPLARSSLGWTASFAALTKWSASSRPA
eukprot:9927277-Alexandrium_andersonii.AAC.1